MGIIFGNLMVYYHLLSIETLLQMSDVGPWAFIVSGLVGHLTGCCLAGNNTYRKTYTFINFYVLAVGLLVLIIGSSILAGIPG